MAVQQMVHDLTTADLAGQVKGPRRPDGPQADRLQGEDRHQMATVVIRPAGDRKVAGVASASVSAASSSVMSRN